MSFDQEPENPFFLASRLTGLAERCAHADLSREARLRTPIFAMRELRGEFPGKSAWDVARSLHSADPLRLPLLRWLHRLTTLRVNYLWSEEDERLLSQVNSVVAEPREQQVTLEQMAQRALLSQDKESILWWKHHAIHSRALAAHRLEGLRRSQEISARLGEPSRGAFFEPVADVKAEGEPATSRSLAREALELSKDLRQVSAYWDHPEPFYAFSQVATGCALSEGWPARIAPDTLRALVASPELLRGTHPEPGPLPGRIVPLSFGRALALLGRALQRCYSPKDLPLIAARDPDDLDGHEFGQVFLLWSMSKHFDEVLLGQGRIKAKERRRHFARALCAHLGLTALRVELLHLGENSQLTRDAFEDYSRKLTGQPLSWSAALVQGQVSLSAQAQFVALLSAAATTLEMISEFDEDWLQNPRAQEKLRADFSRPAQITRTRERCKTGLDYLLDLVRREID